MRPSKNSSKDAKHKRELILNQIESLKNAINKSREYLETGRHAEWRGFRPLFNPKVRDGIELPPHKDWVKNVYLPRAEKALDRAERLLDQFDES